jgi:hypothetical protein
MLKCRKNDFWLENIPNLVCNTELVPLQGMSLASQLNALTRLSIAIFVILLLLDIKWAPLFLLLSILFIIILYYIQKSQMEKFRAEHYKMGKTPVKSGDLPHGTLSTAKVRWINDTISNPRSGPARSILNPENARRFCHDSRPLDYNPELVRNNYPGPNPKGVFNNPEYMSLSQKLAGSANPKTFIAPVVAPPLAAMDYWRANNLVNHSAINTESQVEVYQSGYQTTSCCPGEPTLLVPAKNPANYIVPVQVEDNYHIDDFGHDRRYLNKPKIKVDPTPQAPCHNQLYEGGEVKEGFKTNMPFLKTSPPLEETVVVPNEPGWVNVACGYNPEQLFDAGLPTNLPVGNCPQDPVMKKYNDNLFTQTIQPGLYTRSQINEPINANIGISFNQQFPPTTCKTNEITGEVKYTEHDPRIIEPATVEPSLPRVAIATEANIYDPRFSGYGTSYRSYTDENTGQTRFYYDDIDAIRMPNYITRNNIDHQPFADQYGPLPPGDANGNKNNSNIRALANDAFVSGAIEFRTDLQERLMRKINANAWQQRKAPIRTGGQRMLGGIRIF